MTKKMQSLQVITRLIIPHLQLNRLQMMMTQSLMKQQDRLNSTFLFFIVLLNWPLKSEVFVEYHDVFIHVTIIAYDSL